MKKSIRLITVVVVVVLSLCVCSSLYAGEWRFPLGLSYISGVGDVADRYEDNLDAEGYITDSVESIPVGISFRPYYEFEGGLGVGVDFGPAMIVIGDVDFFNLPVNATCRYTIAPDADTAPYGRLGISHNFASGDYVESGETGFFAAVGVEFMRNKAVAMAVEAAYDSSEIEFENWDNHKIESIKPGGFTLTVAVVF